MNKKNNAKVILTIVMVIALLAFVGIMIVVGKVTSANKEIFLAVMGILSAFAGVILIAFTIFSVSHIVVNMYYLLYALQKREQVNTNCTGIKEIPELSKASCLIAGILTGIEISCFALTGQPNPFPTEYFTYLSIGLIALLVFYAKSLPKIKDKIDNLAVTTNRHSFDDEEDDEYDDDEFSDRYFEINRYGGIDEDGRSRRQRNEDRDKTLIDIQ